MKNEEAREVLLEVAGTLFAERGYRNVTSKEIASKAGFHLSAVNYHFGDKETLFLEVLRYAKDKHQMPAAEQSGTPAEQLEAFLGAMLAQMADGWWGRLIIREALEPSDESTPASGEVFAPIVSRLHTLVRNILPAELHQSEIEKVAVTSLLSQITFYRQFRPLIHEVYPGQSFTAEDVKKLAKLLASYALGALQHYTNTHSGSGQQSIVL